MMAQIVVGYDGSDCGKAALDEALSLAKAVGDGIVLVFGYAPPGTWGGEIAEHEEAIEELGESPLLAVGFTRRSCCSSCRAKRSTARLSCSAQSTSAGLSNCSLMSKKSANLPGLINEAVHAFDAAGLQALGLDCGQTCLVNPRPVVHDVAVDVVLRVIDVEDL